MIESLPFSRLLRLSLKGLLYLNIGFFSTFYLNFEFKCFLSEKNKLVAMTNIDV